MVDLKRITEGKQGRKPRVLIYGGDGVGKTRFAAGAPNPFFIDCNKGSLEYDVKRFIPGSWNEAGEWIAAVETGVVKCDTLVIDSVTDLEHMGNTEFFPGTTIDKWDGGYGRGDGYQLMRWRELLGSLERVWNLGKTIILVGHMTVKHFDDPTGPGYDRYVLAAREKLAGALRQWVDYVLFAKEDIAQQKVAGNHTNMVASGTRWIHTQRSPAFDAKARGTTSFPDRVLLSWDEFAKARAADADRAEALRKEIDAMLRDIGDKKLDELVREYLRANPGMLVEARNRVAARLEETNRSNLAASTTPAAPAA
jgi:hypothetical protein